MILRRELRPEKPAPRSRSSSQTQNVSVHRVKALHASRPEPLGSVRRITSRLRGRKTRELCNAHSNRRSRVARVSFPFCFVFVEQRSSLFFSQTSFTFIDFHLSKQKWQRYRRGARLASCSSKNNQTIGRRSRAKQISFLNDKSAKRILFRARTTRLAGSH